MQIQSAAAVVTVRPLEERDLPAADHIMRLAFGTFVGLPEPGSFMGDADLIAPRWRADPTAAFGALAGDQLVGSNIATNWGSVGFFGPLTVHPDLWDRGIAKLLMEPVLECFTRWNTAHAGLFTFAQSQKHVGLYQRFGFWPRFLTAIVGKPVESSQAAPEWTRFSDAEDPEAAMIACRQLTDQIHDGLDLSREIAAVAAQRLGDTILLWDDGKLAGLAVCHCGSATEAGSGACHVKFGAVAPGPKAARNFERLLDACDAFASAGGLARLTTAVNAARHEAYRAVLARGFRTELQGVAMHRPNEPGYNRPGVFMVDDWR